VSIILVSTALPRKEKEVTQMKKVFSWFQKLLKLKGALMGQPAKQPHKSSSRDVNITINVNQPKG
jgi:hypothetical protein